MKIKTLLLVAVVAGSMFAGCTKAPAPAPAPTPTKTDTKTTASIVNDTATFEKAISKTGTWIIAILNDLTDSNPLILEGDFKNGKKDASGNDIVQRKLALYAQDANKNVTARYTLTAPSITIRSPKAAIWYGTFKGDVYVETNDFQLIGATVNGNVYFKDASAQAGFKADANSKITGKQEIKARP